MGERKVEILSSLMNARADEKIELAVSGLHPGQTATVSSFVDAEGKKFAAIAIFVADADGRINLSEHASLAGNYIGVNSMGLFSHSQPIPGQREGLRLLLSNICHPLHFNIRVYNGQQEIHTIFCKNGYLGDVPPLASIYITRYYMPDTVKRTLVRDGNIRGAFFLPQGDGPFPAVLDLFGTHGGLVQHRASLLAAHGFATLALAYFAYDDLPKDFDTDLEYFEEAIEWLLRQPSVYGDGIGVVGTSKGAELSAELATHFPKVKAAVAISGCFIYWGTKYKGKLLETGYENNPELHRATLKKINGAYTLNYPEINNKYFTLDAKGVIPVERAKGHIMYIIGENDTCMATHLTAKQSYTRLRKHNKTNYEVLSYPGAGHLIEPPYAPLCAYAYHPPLNDIMAFGGQPDMHAHAQEDSWKNILRFLHTHLDMQISKL